MDKVKQKLKGKSKKKGKIALKILFEINIKKTIWKRNRTKLLEDWIGRKRMEKQIVIRNKDITNEDENLLNPIDL